jgi:hypothetical protein
MKLFAFRSPRKIGLGFIIAGALTGCGTSVASSQSGGTGTGGSTTSGSTTGASTVTSSSTGVSGAKRIFITHDRFTGTLANGGGLSGADQTCTLAAQAASLGGSWKAWASTSTANAIDRIVDVGPWFDLKGTKIFANKDGLKTMPLTGLWYDEHGVGLASDDIWTGTNYGGAFSTIPTEQACSDWTSASMQDGARIGQVGMPGANWTAFASTTCDQLAHLICIEQ